MSQLENIIHVCIYDTFYVVNSMIEKYNHYSVYLGKKTKEKIDRYAKEHDLSRSSTIKLMVNEFFLKREANNELRRNVF